MIREEAGHTFGEERAEAARAGPGNLGILLIGHVHHGREPVMRASEDRERFQDRAHG